MGIKDIQVTYLSNTRRQCQPLVLVMIQWVTQYQAVKNHVLTIHSFCHRLLDTFSYYTAASWIPFKHLNGFIILRTSITISCLALPWAWADYPSQASRNKSTAALGSRHKIIIIIIITINKSNRKEESNISFLKPKTTDCLPAAPSFRALFV